MRSEVLLCVENFPAPKTKIDVAHCASHDMVTCTSGFGILLLPCLIFTRIELLVCPSVQLAHIIETFSSWNHRHVVHAGVKTHLHSTPCWRECLTIHFWSPLFGGRGGGTHCSSDKTSSLANLRLGPSAHIRLPRSSHDATT
jgi:hypothetical protein